MVVERRHELLTANKRNCLTKLYLDNKVIGFGSIRLFAAVMHNRKTTSVLKRNDRETNNKSKIENN